MQFVEFVRENFNFLAALRTLNCDFGQAFVALKSWTLIRHGHSFLRFMVRL